MSDGALQWMEGFAICAAAVLFETACAGPDPMSQLRRMRQPSWSPPAWAWVLIGLAWYGIGLTALVRLLPLWPQSAAAILLLVALLFANGAANLLQFRWRRLDWAFWFLAPYWVLLFAFIWALARHDRLSFWLFASYAAYQLYAAAWQYRLWRLNPP